MDLARISEIFSESEQKLGELDSFIDGLCRSLDGHEPQEGALISVLHRAQDIFGYLPEELQNHVAQKLELPPSKVYGVVTFYSFFNTTPKGRLRVNVCTGTACFVRGAMGVLDELKRQLGIEVGETSADGVFSLDALRCVGACGLAPVVSVNGRVYGRVLPEDVKEIIAELLEEGGAAE